MHFASKATSNWADLTRQEPEAITVGGLAKRARPGASRTAFEKYMESGGAWLGFHVSDFMTGIPAELFKEFIGGLDASE